MRKCFTLGRFETSPEPQEKDCLHIEAGGNHGKSIENRICIGDFPVVHG